MKNGAGWGNSLGRYQDQRVVGPPTLEKKDQLNKYIRRWFKAADFLSSNKKKKKKKDHGAPHGLPNAEIITGQGSQNRLPSDRDGGGGHISH